MPKKTKREKIIAQERRRHAALSTSPSLTTATPPPNKAQALGYQFTFAGSVQSNPKTRPAISTDLVIIRQDLTKTLMLALVAVIIELLLYWKFQF